MLQFDAGKAFVHLVFANLQEEYTLPSLIRVSRLQEYLAYLLRKNGYVNVIFWDHDQDQSIITPVGALGESGKGLFSKKKTFIAKLSGAAQEDTNRLVTGSPVEVTDLLCRAAACKEKTAVITSLGLFYKTISKDMMKKIRHAQVQTGQNILILTTGCSSADSMTMLQDDLREPARIFRVDSLIGKPSTEKDFYSRLAGINDGAVSFLNEISEDEMRQIARRDLLFDDALRPYLGKADLLCAFMSHFYHSEALRAGFFELLDENETHLRSTLSKTVFTRKSMIDAILRWIDKQYQTGDAHYLKKQLKLDYRLDPESVPIRFSGNPYYMLWKNVRDDLVLADAAISEQKDEIERKLTAISSYEAFVPNNEPDLELMDELCNGKIFKNDPSPDHALTQRLLRTLNTWLNYFFEPDEQATKSVHDIALYISVWNDKLLELKKDETERAHIDQEIDQILNKAPDQLTKYDQTHALALRQLSLSLKKKIDGNAVFISQCEELVGKIQLAMEFGKLDEETIRTELTQLEQTLFGGDLYA